MAGYIKLYRGSRDTDGIALSAHYSEWEAWTWLLENAAWKTLARRNAKGEEVTLQPGQIHVSIRSLATAWGWSNKAVRTFLTRLERVSKVAQSKAQSGTVLTICNWDKYQGSDEADGHSQRHSRGTVGAQSGHTQEEGKEGKEENNKGDYAFDGSVIRLNFADYRRWQNGFPDLDLRALLTARDLWLEGQSNEIQRKWFQTTPNWLANKQQASLERRRRNPMIDDDGWERPIV